MNLLSKAVLSVVVGIVAFLVALLVGTLLQGIPIRVVVLIGTFLDSWAGVIGLLTGLWYFFTGGVSLDK